MIRTLCSFIFAALCASWSQAAPHRQFKVNITPDGKANMIVCLPESDKATGRAVVVCPGGGYEGLGGVREIHDAAHGSGSNRSRLCGTGTGEMVGRCDGTSLSMEGECIGYDLPGELGRSPQTSPFTDPKAAGPATTLYHPEEEIARPEPVTGGYCRGVTSPGETPNRRLKALEKCERFLNPTAT